MKLSKAAIKKYGISKRAWNYQRSLSSRSGAPMKRSKTVSRGVSMAKRKRSYGKSRSFGSGMMKAPIATNGMFGDALKGVGGALAVAKFAPNINIPYKYPLAGYLVGGVSGAVAAWFVMGTGVSGSGSSDLSGFL